MGKITKPALMKAQRVRDVCKKNVYFNFIRKNASNFLNG